MANAEKVSADQLLKVNFVFEILRVKYRKKQPKYDHRTPLKFTMTLLWNLNYTQIKVRL